MRFGTRAILAACLGCAAALVTACGSSGGLLSGAQSSTLSGRLGAVSAAVQAHDCGRAADAGTALNNEVADLPASVDTTLAENLARGAETVAQLAEQDCSATETHTATSSSSSSSSSTSTPRSTPTTTTTTVTTTTTAPTTTTSSTHSATNTTPAGTSGTTPGGGAPVGGQTTGKGGGGG